MFIRKTKKVTLKVRKERVLPENFDYNCTFIRYIYQDNEVRQFRYFNSKGVEVKNKGSITKGVDEYEAKLYN